MSSFSTPPRQPILPVDDPTESWERVRSHQIFAPPPTSAAAAAASDDDDERPARALRIACISDTHGRHRSITVPPCDVLIHAGDFTNVGEPEL